MDPLAKLLNPEQLEAVRHREGPLLILAGAGSGKTRVLTHRIAHLLRENLARPGEIFAVTFTNKAAGELRERVAHLVGGPAAERMWVATFHAAGARILRREAESLGLTRAFAIYDDSDQLAAMKRVCSDLGQEPSLAKQHLSRVDKWKNEGKLPDQVKLAEHDIPGKTALKAYARYQAALQASNALDFGDLIVRVVELFKKRPDVLQYYASRFRFVLVDEFQDTNPAQYELLRLLTSVHGNLCVVGDDDQSIYRWRGAEVSNILDFPKDFSGCKVVKLEQNYRSTGNILAAAHAVIEKNEERAAKKLWTASGAGEKLQCIVAEDERDEASRVASGLYAENARGTSYREMAVFYRANAQSRVLEDALRARRIPYRVVRGRSFYDRAEVKDVSAYLRLCVNPRSDGDLLRIINTPPRGIGDTTVDRLRASATRQGVSLWEALEHMEDDVELPANARTKLVPFRQLLADLQRDVAADGRAAEAIAAVLERTNLEDRYRLEGEEGEERVENLRELRGAARDFDVAWEEARENARQAVAAGVDGGGDAQVVQGPGVDEDVSFDVGALEAPGGLGSPQADAPEGERPDVAAALAAAQPDLDDPQHTADTPLLGFLEQLALVGDADAEGDGERVSLMTLHAAKGLEFDAVFLTGLEDRVFPNSRSLGLTGALADGEEDPAQLAEERRLCYVGMTRARKRLHLTLARCRSLFGELRFNPPSRFLREVPAALCEGLGQLDFTAREGRSPFDQDRGRGGGGSGGPSWARGLSGGNRFSRDDFDQRNPWEDDGPRERPGAGGRSSVPPQARPPLRRESRVDPAARPPPRPLAAGAEGWGPGTRERHPSFGVGSVEDTEGAGQTLKLTIRFPPGVGLKKVLARFVEKI